jgi:hypothetical protein
MHLYKRGEYPSWHSKPCNAPHPWSRARCIIDNPHIGRPHWGPSPDGNFQQWGLAGPALVVVPKQRRPQH